MKKKSLLILLFMVYIGMFMPREVFALQVYNNVNIDYRFFVDENESNAGTLNFKLYDKSGDLFLNSEYDSATKQYYFEYVENKFHKFTYTYTVDGEEKFYNYWRDNGEEWEDKYRGYVPVFDSFSDINFCSEEDYYCYIRYNESEFNSFILRNNLTGSYNKSSLNDTWTFYTYVPMILENVETGIKKIVLQALIIAMICLSMFT